MTKRSIPIPSATSLRAEVRPSKAALPTAGLDAGPLRLTRIDPARRMARYYTVAVEVTLFADIACTRRYGRIGARGGRVMVGLYATEAEAVVAFGRIVGAKLARGYRPAP